MNNKLTSLKLSQNNTNLRELWANGNKFTSFDFSGFSNLNFVILYDNNLNYLNISGINVNPSYFRLYVNGNPNLNSIYVSNATVLDYLVSARNAGNKGVFTDPAATFIVPKASQTISFGTIPSVGVGQTGMISATATSGLDVAFSSSTTSVCSVAANGQPNQANVTGVSTGICGIAANQAGDTTYAAATETVQYINIRATANPPSAPTITSLVAGPGRVVINFTQPSSNGGSAIVSYTATCTATGKATRTATGTGTPLVVNGLVGGTGYSCTLTASNGSYSSAASAVATVTPKKALDLSPIIMLLLDD